MEKENIYIQTSKHPYRFFFFVLCMRCLYNVFHDNAIDISSVVEQILDILHGTADCLNIQSTFRKNKEPSPIHIYESRNYFHGMPITQMVDKNIEC